MAAHPTKPGPKASKRPTPREMRVLRATADGCSLKVAAERLGIPEQQVAHILSHVYRRLFIPDLGYARRKERRQLAIDICVANHWWQGRRPKR
jgi:DNA-binding NarL/FixJ family response regulator